MKKSTHKRQGIIDIWRFIACLMIMIHHLDNIGFTSWEYPFYSGFIFVEFFFIISGYFAVVHFRKCMTSSVDDRAREAIYYTYKKFAYFFPYTFIAISIIYLINIISGNVCSFTNYIFEITLIAGSFKDYIFTSIPPLWFLAALIIVFPFFTFLCQMKSKYVLFMISFYVPLFIYGYFEQMANIQFPISILRALSALLLGNLVWELSSKLGEKNFSKIHKIILTIMEIGISSFIFYNLYHNNVHFRFAILCFLVLSVIILSKQSYTSNINGKFYSYLGKISMVIYVMHWVIIAVIKAYFPFGDNVQKLIIYFSGTLFFSIIVNLGVEKITKIIHAGR